MDRILDNETSGYKVQTEVYEGPLDLLLNLIERTELDITAVSLASVTGQYLKYLNSLEKAHPDEISAFLVIAAKLIQIKSEALLPRPPEIVPGEEDIGAALIEQLKLYKRFKEIANILQDREAQNLRSYLRLAPPLKVEAKLDLSDISVADLLEAATSIYKKELDKQALGTIISAPKITIREKIELISKILGNSEHTHFLDLLGDNPSRIEIVVTFLALLELVKRYHVSVKQESLFSEIEIERAGDWSEEVEIEIEFE
ncbi:MAG: segregation/condensation protein A [Anaerolineae bacterium]|nr:segregation/condensation protein A [Anaerolineae bacterium]MDK1080134.1 segregation/condensation protein A [Anaerolineae bacterium]MDK1117199.1 segregation/condensation protein A [Anaerolineae bacterium]